MTLFFQKGILFAGELPDEGGGHYKERWGCSVK
jgi:hypothetical protein